MFSQLLARGYLPKELPPAFGSARFGSAAPAIIASSHLMKWDKKAKLCRHNLVRAGALRRGLAIPNPVPFIRLAKRLSDDWNLVAPLLERSSLSRSAPVLDTSTSSRAIRSSNTYEDLPHLRAASRAGRTYICSTDVSNFYASVYTHSIPWALEGKAAAKARPHDDTLGNALDTWVRSAQDGQTMGIPVGPDTSLVIAEVILSAIDSKLAYRGFRFFDDYELACTSPWEAESALSQLQQHLSEFELSLNPRKTQIARLPQRLEPEWTSDLRRTEIRGGDGKQAIDLLAYFDKMAEYAQRHPEENVMRYGVATLVKQPIAHANFELFTSLLLQAAAGEPGVLPSVLLSLLAHEQDGRKVPRERLSELLDHTIHRHAPLGHGSEVAWALWGLLCFGIKLRAETSRRAAAMEDSVVALLALDAVERKLLRGVTRDVWKRYFDAEELWGEHWLLSYEAGVKGWSGTSHVQGHHAFKALAEAGVAFYTPVSRAQAKADAAAAAKKTKPEY